MHQAFLLKALELAKIHRGSCAPNPAVGAVVVKDSQIIAEGYHLGSGHEHAEVSALQKISPEESVGASLYVTLEPCCHTGKTPPCTDLIFSRQLCQVIYAKRDANPRVAGRGEQTLKEAGITCWQESLSDIDDFYQSYDYWWQNKLPFVTAKLALSSDGKIANASGARVILTGPSASLLTHQLRKQSDAILTTSTTVIADDPQFTARIADKIIPKKLYVLDSEAKIPLTAAIFHTQAPIVILHEGRAPLERVQALNERGVTTHVLPSEDKLSVILPWLGSQGIHDLWVEAGGTLISELLHRRLVNRLWLYVAPTTLGPTAKSGFHYPDLLSAAKEVRWMQRGRDGVCELIF